MKTIRTRVTSAFRRNSKGTPAAATVPLTLPAASTSAPSVLFPEKIDGTSAPPGSPVTPTEQNRQFPGKFHLDSDRRSESPVNDEKQDDLDLTGLTFTGDEPEHVYIPPQSIPITDDSRRSTPKKRITSVPRVSSDSRFPSPSIASRLQTTLPPSNGSAVGEIKFVSPVDTNYLLDKESSEPSLLDQLAPTDPSFVELTPKEVPSALPPLHEVLAHQAHLKRLDSRIEVARVPSFHDAIPEDKPLLESSFLTADVDDILDSVWPLPTPSFPSLGWSEHVLPSSSYYYSHAATRTVTDIDLRDEKKLAAVRAYLKSKLSPTNEDGSADQTLRGDSMPYIEEGVDLWLRDANPGLQTKAKSEWEFMPMRNWVLHATRAVTFDPPSERDGYQTQEDLSDEDRLDLENRYWQYMSTHPAHASLPQTAYDEAVEVLTWCYTDRVLRTPQLFPISPPFTQRECTEILDLLRNVAAIPTSTSNAVVRTRLVAQILLRFTEWRQKYVSRASKPADHLVSPGTGTETVEHAIPFRRTLLRFVKGVLCLGIPYLFESRDTEGWTSTRPTDEEDQRGTRLPRSDDPGLMNSQVLVAALLLSASVTFLALPDLNETSRVAALIAALCAAASMVSFVITLYGRRHRFRTHESWIMRAQNSLLASLPLVMLAYSLCALVVGVIAYSLGGNVPPSRGGGFGKHTGWVVIAVWLVLVAILAASGTFMRKGL